MAVITVSREYGSRGEEITQQVARDTEIGCEPEAVGGISNRKKVTLLQDISAFAELTTEQLNQIASITTEMALAPDTTIIQQDKPAEALYLVAEGKVRFHRDGREVMVAEAKDVFGAWSLFDTELLNIATATTLEPTRLLKIDREAFYAVVADSVEIAAAIFKSLARHFIRVALN